MVSDDGRSHSQRNRTSICDGEYRLLGLVGQGQFAQVYCAVHRRSGRLFAIKQIRHARRHTSEEGLKYEQQNGLRNEKETTKEAVLLRQLYHPNILKCHVASEQRLILDYCEVGTLRSHLSTAFSPQFKPGHLSSLTIKYLIEDILEGLIYLHRHGVVHSDLKPENILLTMPIPNRLTAKISDFGCAHPLDQPNQSKVEIGSPYYAAPERFEGYSSIASDLYSVGIMLYELWVGDRPFTGTHHQLQRAHKSDSPYFPSTLPPAVQHLLSTALHKQPGSRFANAADMLDAFKKVESDPVHLTAKSVSAPASQNIDLATVESSLRARSVVVHGITASVDSLTTLPRGCCIVTKKSLHILTKRRELMSIARFKQPCWISVSPNGRWFVALPKSNKHRSQGMIGKLSRRSGHQWCRSITLKSRLLTALLTDVVQTIAIDSRYFLRIRTARELVRTYLECFTRRGQFVGELRFNQSITQIMPTATPYQLVALSDDSPSAQPVMLLIDLKPFKVRTVRLPFIPQQVHTLAWGYLVVGEQMTVLLDRNAQPVTLLKGLPNSRAIASLDNRQLLLANHATQPSLSIIDASALNLGVIF